jgi:serine/threonine protein kinase
MIDRPEFLIRALDCRTAHKEAFAIGYIHRDISAGNIIIFNGRGYLIDWDLAKATNLPHPRRATRTVCGTLLRLTPTKLYLILICLCNFLTHVIETGHMAVYVRSPCERYGGTPHIPG